MDCRLVLLLVAVVVGTQAATTKAPKTKIINSAEKCGTTHTVGLENEFLLSGNGQITAGTGTCAFTFNVEGSTCESMCYIFNQYSYFNDARARLSVGGQTYDKDYDITAVPVCVDGTSLSLSLTLDSGYVYDKKNSGYKFDVTVYSKCGEKGSVTNIEFEEAIKDLNGYHHGKDREEREKMTFVTGIVLGFGLASIFLVVLLFGYCYTRNSPNRGPNRSAGMPKVGGFKKTMTPGTEPKEVEMGVRYQAKDPDRPEAAALLVGDPEKPPVEVRS